MFKLLIIVAAIALGFGLAEWKGDRTILEAVSDIASSTASTTTASLLEKVTSPLTPKQTTPSVPAGAGARTFENGVYVTTIFYTIDGFVPATLELKHGEEVRFVNKTSAVMHVIGDDKASSQYYRTVNQPNTLGKGGTNQIALPDVGLFSYYNLGTNPRVSGQVFVK